MRAFVAVGLEQRAREEIARTLGSLDRNESAARWVRPENLHLTLAFLGEIEPQAVAAIDERLAPLAASVPECGLVLAGAGGFPPERPHVLWLGVVDGADWFVDLAAAVRETVEDALGLELDRREPAAHLTVARLRRPDRRLLPLLEEAFAQRAIRSRADAMTLYSSELGAGGPLYRVERRWPFGGAVGSRRAPGAR